MSQKIPPDVVLRFRHQAIESSINGIGFADQQGHLIYANASFLRMWGYDDLSDVLGRHVMSFGSSDEQTQSILTAIVEQGGWVGEAGAKKKNGEPFTVEMSASLVRDDDGNVVGIMGSFIDVTERKQVQQALRDSEERYRTLVESAQDPIFVADASGRYLYVNTAAATFIGMTPDYVIGKTVDELFPPDVAERYRAGVTSVIATGDTLAAEDVLEIDGQMRWMSTIVQPVRDRHGAITAAQAIVRDITKLKQAEGALRESEERLRQAVRVSNIGIFDHNHVTDAVYLSPEQRAILGLDENQNEPALGSDLLPSKNGWALVHPEDRERVVSEVRRAHEGGDGIYDSEYRMVRRDGTVRWVTVRSQTFFEGSGETRRPVRSVGATRDITEQKEAEEERGRLHAQLIQAQKMESIGRLAGGVAHDFNNMLGVILGHVELLMGQVDATGPIFADLQQIKNAAQRSADLTRQLLAFARRQTVAPKVLDLNDVVAGSIQMLRRMIGEDIELVWLPGRDLWPVRIDPIQVHQILANLSANARDAIAGVGRFTVRTENVAFDDVYCMTHTGFLPGQYVVLDVTDDGRGMDAETQAHIFEPFYTTKAEGYGTGLGLATVYGIVQQNEGLIEAKSAVGVGTSVRILLPRFKGETAAASTQDQGDAQAGSETVLLVEDEPMVLRLSKRSLERLGYKVLTASTPGEAIRLSAEHAGDIDLLITDVVMPEMNGRDLAEQLSSVDPRLKKLFVSGYSASALAPRGVLDDGVHFLQKPFTLNDLAVKVREVLEAN